jgi:hypothetical protein
LALKYWEIIADNLHKAGWSLGWVATVDRKGRTIWIVDASVRKAFRRACRLKADCVRGTARANAPLPDEFDVEELTAFWDALANPDINVG